MRHPDTHAVVLRRKENTLRRTVYNQYIWAAGALGVSSRWRATVSPMELTYLPTGQKIMFFGLDDPGNLKHWRALQSDFVEQTGLKRQYDRERVGG